LLWYGFGALKTALSSNLELASAEVMKQGRWKIIVTMLAVTWLNPHVYLDTFVVLGSLAGSWRWSRSAGLRWAPLALFPVVLWPGAAGRLAGAAAAYRQSPADQYCWSAP
jgi:arginine exporter protein ArgO